MKNLNNSINKISEKFKVDKKSVIVIIIGVIGIILLVVSELIPSESKNDSKKNEDDTVAITYSDYEKDVEERLESLISKIDGAGSVRVMVTLDCTVESVYAQKEKETAGENKSRENEYVIIKSSDGESGILLKTTQPKIRGVAVVCSGGNSAVVRQNITNTVTAVLGISSARVNISAMKSTVTPHD